MCCAGWMAGPVAKRSWEEKGGDGGEKKESRQESMHDETTTTSPHTAPAHGDRQNALSRNFVPGASDKMRVVNSQAAWNKITVRSTQAWNH